MNRTSWITLIIVAVVFGGGGFYGGMQYQLGQAASARAAFTGNFAGRTGAGAAGRTGLGAGGGATFGSIVAITPTSFTVQLMGTPGATTTSTTATGSKLVLYDASTQINELQSVPSSNLAVGQNVTVTGTANSDGSVTATSVQIRPASGRAGGTSQTPTAPTSQQ